MSNNWYLYCKKGDFEAISEEFKISPILARILVNRNLRTSEQIRSFLMNGMESMHDPYLMKDMDRAVDITLKTISAGKKIRIIGDYDMDGVCSATILKKFFEYIGADADVRLPHRIFEGYGMNEGMVCKAAEEGISLIITCDNGVSSYDAVCRARDLGINVVITDHHEPPQILPPAYAIVNAKQADCTYPYKELCGAGVCYKFAKAITKQLENNGYVFPEGKDLQGLMMLLDDLMQFAGMATIADIVPLTGENRIFAREGIKRLKKTANPGLLALIKVKDIDPDTISEYHIGFVLGPCVNSAGRLDDAKIAFDLFDTDDPETAWQIANELSQINEKRKNLTREQAQIASDMINEMTEKGNDDIRIVVIYLPDAHESVAGIIAGKLKDDFSRPVLVITDSEEGLKGSGRSTDDYNLIGALSRHAGLLKKFGGHAKAAGFTLDCTPRELSEALNSESEAENITGEKKIWIDMQLPFRYITEELVNELKKLEPYGLDNERPRFAEKNVTFTDLRIIGKNRNVLKAGMVDPDGGRMEGIYFGHENDPLIEEVSEIFSRLKSDVTFSIIYRPNINEYMNMRYPQAVIEAIRAEV